MIKHRKGKLTDRKEETFKIYYMDGDKVEIRSEMRRTR